MTDQSNWQVGFDGAVGLKVLAVDDEPSLLATLVDFLTVYGFEVVTATNGQEALQVARSQSPDIIIMDVVMPVMGGFETVKQFKVDAVLRFIPVILLTGRDTVDEIAYGLEQGADDYLVKPFEERELSARILAALRSRRLYSELARVNEQVNVLQDVLVKRFSFANIVGQSDAMQQLFSLIDKVSVSDVPVLINGESGTGKELVARAIHYNSVRQKMPFVVQNCAAFQDTLLEAELFGFVRGAFTGAHRDKVGIFEMAHQGTLFLDEVGEMSMALQAKLLRVLQDGTFTSVGDHRVKKVDVRVVCASHRNLFEMVKSGAFREDLYYRINVVELKIPPLRERRDDILLLVKHFLHLYDPDKERVFSSSALRLLIEYDWPGNVRQLQNEIRRALVLADGNNSVLDVSLLSQDLSPVETHFEKPATNLYELESLDSVPNLKEELERIELDLIRQVLILTRGNKSEAARRLGISRSNLISKLQQTSL